MKKANEWTSVQQGCCQMPRDSWQISLCQKPFSSWHREQHCMRLRSFCSLALSSIVLNHHHQPPLVPRAHTFISALQNTLLVGCSTALKLFQSELGKNKHTHNHNYTVRPRECTWSPEEPRGHVLCAGRWVSLLQREPFPESRWTGGCLSEALLSAAVSSTDSCGCWLWSSQSSSRAPTGTS